MSFSSRFFAMLMVPLSALWPRWRRSLCVAPEMFDLIVDFGFPLCKSSEGACELSYPENRGPNLRCGLRVVVKTTEK